MQSSSNSVRTLKGVFEVPKMNHRRDFLRENKLNLRELQKNTTQKLTQQKQEQDRQQGKHLQRYNRAQEQFASRRSNSQQRFNGEDLRQRPSQRAAGGVTANDAGQRNDVVGQENRLAYRRSYSQQRERREHLQPSYPAASFDNCGNGHRALAEKDLRVPRSASAVSIVSKAESCDKEIQTEDIIDEEFLYDALKKCSTTEIGFRHKTTGEDDCNANPATTTTTRSNISTHNQQHSTKYEEHKTTTHSREHVQFDYGHEPKDAATNYNDQCTERSEYNYMQHNGHNGNAVPRTHQHSEEDDHRLREDFHNLHINCTQRTVDSEAQSSARSRQTQFSNFSRKKTNDTHKLGNREDLRLPRYLEKEKRAKEEERVREMSRDPNCPLGYYALAEEERLANLNAAQKKMASLIQELNRMPMTTETLRIRSRKVEIEKELTKIELDIRTFSKPKVYVMMAEPSLSSMQY